MKVSRPGKQAVPSTFRCRKADISLKDLQSTLPALLRLHVGAALSLTSFPGHRELTEMPPRCTEPALPGAGSAQRPRWP